MFRSILIANRGEIACRIIDTCRRMGVWSVAVFSDADAGARHVMMADTAVRIGPAAAAESYLSEAAIIAAAHAAGAEAIHPGYGFLSENPGFADAVARAGLVFIGPSPEAIRAMGLKDAAKALMEKAGVPVVLGYHGAAQDDAALAAEAQAIGYPVLIKAVAGGGGKGMRLVKEPGRFGAALKAARSEARGAFGNDRVLVEKFIPAPRHIEVQVFGDGAAALHLFERDCSLQRRHQKVIEEAPAPGMTDAVRAAMGAAAVRAAEAIGYRGAGTVEFIADGSGPLRTDGFWFMEMNTRLQVEHPVTEAITGVDLVEWQLRVAAGEGLPVRQDALGIRGHAVEARLYAEDVPAGFLPATGQIAHLEFARGVRVETGVNEGDAITPWYDPMIAKLVAHGPSREAALSALSAALGETRIAGLTTNLAFLRALAEHEDFRAGRVDTGLIGRDIEALSALPRPCARSIALAALAALGLERAGGAAGFALWAPLEWRADLIWRGEAISARVRRDGDGWAVRVGAEEHRLSSAGGGWRIGDRQLKAGWHVSDASAGSAGREITVFFGNTYVFFCPDPLAREGADGAGDGAVLAPMPGAVRAVHVAVGEQVAAGAPLAILEAMKMEHELTAPMAGRVAICNVAGGDQVAAGDLMFQLEAAP